MIIKWGGGAFYALSYDKDEQKRFVSWIILIILVAPPLEGLLFQKGGFERKMIADRVILWTSPDQVTDFVWRKWNGRKEACL